MEVTTLDSQCWSLDEVLGKTNNLTGNMSVDVPKVQPNPLQLTFMWVVILLMMMLNIVVFLAMPRFQTHLVGTRIGMLSLAVTDFLLSGSLVIFHTYNLAFWRYQVKESDALCLFEASAISVLACTSLWTLMFLNLDRLLTMTYPLRYPQYMTKSKHIAVHVFIWVLMTCRRLPSFINPSNVQITYYEYAFTCVTHWRGDLFYNLFGLTILLVIPTVVISVSFIRVLIIAGRRTVRGRQERSQMTRNLRIVRTLSFMTGGKIRLCIYKISNIQI